MSEETKKPAEEQTKKAEYISEKAMAEILKGIRQTVQLNVHCSCTFKAFSISRSKPMI